MTPYRPHGRGTFPLDRRFSKVLGPGNKGRIQVASGTTDVKLWREMNVMLDQFARRRPELLEEIRDGRLHPLQAYRYWSSGEWERIPVGKHLKPLVDTAQAWAERKPKRKGRGLSPRTREERIRWAAMVARYARDGATLDDLPAIMERRREDCDDEDTASAFNHDRSYARAFLRDEVKKSDRLYLAVVDIAPLEETRKVGRNPQTLPSARAIAEKLGGEAGRIWLDLCYNGMNLKEFYEDGWANEYELEAVVVHGEKRDARSGVGGTGRLVPMARPVTPPTLTRQGFRSALRRAKLGVTPHDARRSYRVWLAEAGIEKTHRDYYAGHSPRSMEQLYTDPGEAMVLIKAWLKEDGPKLRAYLGLERAGLQVASA